MRKVNVLVCITLIACLLFSGCSGEISANKKRLSLRLLDETVSGAYTGLLKNGIPSGEGAFASPDQSWTYTGTFSENAAEAKDGELTGGFPISVTVDGVTYPGTYSGAVQGNQITGAGKFSAAEDAFAYEGEWLAGKPSGAGRATKLNYEILFQEREITGVYSGEMIDAVPNGNGTFSTEDGDFLYKGEWKDGDISGQGHLIDQSYVVHFSSGDRTGPFEGMVQNGIAEGSGTFTGVNSNGVGYTYEGEWSNGLFNGMGYCKFENNYLEDGHFTDGEYTPDLYDTVKSIGTVGNFIRYELTAPAAAFIQKHPEVFPADGAESLQTYLDANADYQTVMESPESHGGRMMRFENMEVLQIWEESIFQHEHFTIALLADHDTYSSFVFAFYPEALPDVQAKDTVTVYGIPMNASSYRTTEGETNRCLAFLTAYAEKS